MCYHPPDRDGASVGRASFLRGLAACVALPVLAVAPASAMPWYAVPERELWMARFLTHTGQVVEPVRAAFTLDGRTLNVDGYVQLCARLRDTEVDSSRGIVQMSPALLQVLWELQVALGMRYGPRPILIHSGYRTVYTNAHTKDAVPGSVHCAGGACDFHVPGVPLRVVADTLRRVPLIGGLGYYPGDGGDGSTGGWIHGDVGSRREWVGFRWAGGSDLRPLA